MGIAWDPKKSSRLKAARGAGFQDLLDSTLLALLAHPTRPNQKFLLFERGGYVWVVPCVMRGDEVFLKTAFPSRKYTKLWKLGELP